MITFFYGTNDGGTAALAWSNSVALGAQSGGFAQAISGLASNQTYYFTARAVNSAGTAWAAPSRSFTTLSNVAASVPGTVLTYHNQ